MQGFGFANQTTLDSSLGSTKGKSKEPLDFQNIKINYYEEEANYDGGPLINPQIPYYYHHEFRRVDKTLPFFKKAAQKMKYMTLDFKDYVADLIFLRDDKFAFKTATFVKRHKKAWGNVLHHAWDECVKLGRGFKMFNEDMKIYFKYRKGKREYKYDKLSYR